MLNKKTETHIFIGGIAHGDSIESQRNSITCPDESGERHDCYYSRDWKNPKTGNIEKFYIWDKWLFDKVNPEQIDKAIQSLNEK